MASFKEIVTKAVVGKGKKYFKNNYSIEVQDKPTTVLGCWVINHKFKGYKTGEKVGVDGTYDVNKTDCEYETCISFNIRDSKI